MLLSRFTEYGMYCGAFAVVEFWSWASLPHYHQHELLYDVVLTLVKKPSREERGRLSSSIIDV